MVAVVLLGDLRVVAVVDRGRLAEVVVNQALVLSVVQSGGCLRVSPGQWVWVGFVTQVPQLPGPVLAGRFLLPWQKYTFGPSRSSCFMYRYLTVIPSPCGWWPPGLPMLQLLILPGSGGLIFFPHGFHTLPTEDQASQVGIPL
ncbi:MAG: hypothetical protein F4135_05020 [Acidimicrobiia bacterium]|nr:hypothetical protein [Acidimicrobiia bacterium]